MRDIENVMQMCMVKTMRFSEVDAHAFGLCAPSVLYAFFFMKQSSLCGGVNQWVFVE